MLAMTASELLEGGRGPVKIVGPQNIRAPGSRTNNREGRAIKLMKRSGNGIRASIIHIHPEPRLICRILLLSGRLRRRVHETVKRSAARMATMAMTTEVQ